jgi:hypothetical protein
MKTLEYFKNEIAKKKKYSHWALLIQIERNVDSDELHDQAAELYAQQAYEHGLKAASDSLRPAVRRLQMSILAGDPTERDLVFKDLRLQAEQIMKQVSPLPAEQETKNQ